VTVPAASLFEFGAALEEAAHAHLAMVGGRVVDRIALERDANGNLVGGFCDHRRTADPGTISDEVLIRTKLAGITARRLAGITDPPLSSRADLDGVDELLRQGGWDDDYLAELWTETEAIVRGAFPAIVKLAVELLRRGAVRVAPEYM